MARNWEAEYQALLSGDMKPESFSTADLFEMASALAVKADWMAKAKIYEDYIFTHPEASDDDTARVVTYRADMARRMGDPERALQMLSELAEPADPMALAEYLQAQSECRVSMKQDEKALELKRRIVQMAENKQAIPADKKLYYLYGVIEAELRLEEMASATQNLIRYRHLLEDQSLNPGVKDYSWAAFHDLEGTLYESVRDTGGALESYQAYFEKMPAIPSKAVTAMKYLYTAWQHDPQDRSKGVLAMAEYFKAHEGEMLPTYVESLRTKYDFVQGIIAKLGHT